ncbi:MAG: hypothetical protein KC503_26985 [Myxococcales bacterium]|nr:hypothetical protein [Myxococcales bacterium]
MTPQTPSHGALAAARRALPLAELAELASRAASGRFVCRAREQKIEIYLREGRVAWAEDKLRTRVFIDQLRRRARLDQRTLRRIVRECRSTRRSLAAALVDAGLASYEDVRASLRQHIGSVIAELAALDAPRTEQHFFERSYGTYDRELTFDLSEMITRYGSLLESTLRDGASFVAVRCVGGSLLGAALRGPDEPALWCRVRNEDYGATIVSLRREHGAIEREREDARDAEPLASSTLACTHGDAEGSLARVLAQAVGEVREVSAAFVLTREPGADPLCGFVAQGLDVEQTVALARRRARCLEQGPAMGPGCIGADRSARCAGCIASKRVVSCEPDRWVFAAELPRAAAPGAVVVLMCTRRTSQGIGWAHLSTLQQALAYDAYRRAVR